METKTPTETARDQAKFAMARRVIDRILHPERVSAIEVGKAWLSLHLAELRVRLDLLRDPGYVKPNKNHKPPRPDGSPKQSRRGLYGLNGGRLLWRV
jgi:hypothetical protein